MGVNPDSANDLAIEAAIELLYRRPLAEFIAARNELAASLKRENPDAAARVKTLTKPSVSAWAVNQLPAEAPEVYRALIAAGAALHGATGAGADGLRAAMAARREALDEAMRYASAVLERAGHATSMSTLRRVSLTLEALAAHGGGPGAPRAGRLSADVDPPALDQLALFAAAAPRAPVATVPTTVEPPPAPASNRDREAAFARARASLAEADADLQVLTHEARRAREARADTAERFAAIEARVEEARARLAELEDKLARAQHEARDARSAERRADAAEARARQRTDRARARLDELERDVD